MVRNRVEDSLSADGAAISAPLRPDEAQRRFLSVPRAASELALRRLELNNLRAGHENAGFLSAGRGYLPIKSPLTRLEPQFSAWDELAAELPLLYRSLGLRKRVERLPILEASADCLDARYVMRACSLLAIVSHAYWYVDSRPPGGALPESLRRPWAQLRKRLGRTQEVINYIDLIVYNWRLRDPTLANPLVVENLELLFPTVGNQEERVFYMTQLEILARTTPVVRQVATAQGAVLRQDDEALEAALLEIIDCLGRVVHGSLPKINPNPYSDSHVDPVVWAKTVAPFAVPIHAGDQGPSGTSSPLFNTLDLFFGRKDYASFLGREIKQLRAHYPRSWQVYLSSLTELSVARYIEERGSRTLRSAFREAFELYAGESGFLGRHRMKVYGYLELAFKVGRSVTIGGFGGVFTDRTWDVVDRELAASQNERLRAQPHFVHHARVLATDSTAEPARGIRRITLDISKAGVRYRPGDRCLILPENDPELVERTLKSLDLPGEQAIALTAEWKAYAKDRVELYGQTEISARELLCYGTIRPVSPRLAEALHARTQSDFLFDAIVRGCTERWELWELVELLRARGLSPATLWRHPDGNDVRPSELLSRLIPPQRFRVYSVSSAPRSALRRGEDEIELTVGELSYAAPSPVCELGTAQADVCPFSQHTRRGTGSSFLARAQSLGSRVVFRIQHPDVFRLPEDPETPIVMFAGGSGIAPFRAFLQERARSARSTPALLFLSVRSPDEFVYGEEFESAVALGGLSLEVAFTRTGGALVLGGDGRLSVEPAATARVAELMLAPVTAARLWQLAQTKAEGGAGAVFYVCGRSGFADTVLVTLKRIFRDRLASLPGADLASVGERAAGRVYQMVGDRRLLSELHTDARPLDDRPRLFDLSEIARHNDARHGYWIVVDRVVYDLTEFIELHPGGRRVVQAYAGMDASHGFARAHHGRADVDAMRESYRIGMVRTLRFDDHVVRVEAPSGEVVIDSAGAYRSFAKALALVVEMQNALVADQSLQSRPEADGSPALGPDGERSAYRLQRAVETHRRFLKNYFAVLLDGTLPELWSIAHGLFFSEQPADGLQTYLTTLRGTEPAVATELLARQAFDSFETWREGGALHSLVEAFEASDVWFLHALKAALSSALREFERHGARVRTRGAARVQRACQRMAGIVRQYYARSTRELQRVVRVHPLPSALSAQTVGTNTPATTRLYTGTHWVFEEDSAAKLAVLRRTPVAAGSLIALSDENELVLRCMLPRHREFGLVVDMRQARLRNDSGFEDAMARLRRELTAHFRRTAVLLESTIGELQVSRIERDERRDAIATRSESSAFKFAQGGA
jgi:sulfite reductase alpha subunit-like flavoprotein/cytochrome b involved in lipid metabolism